ncbi:type II toxin-antitoxin system VapC family toxin [Pseudoclavibacter alba]|uniref:type II toxin-antitoxin system VapC family toxin n=1 Tax=Pseudoclavibacter albus TaxID=272241 RepID=UPI0019CF9E8F|nr:type II toxin-antitoxin system VapC family toxin [Pseudoclavibacter alba]MBN6777576.1 type II toxin-antitoxin system VapC family toxin [Pseudoclavibacter alba]
MIVLDTNVVSELLRRDPDTRVLQWFEVQAEELAITSVTWAELLAGVELLPEGKRRRELRSALLRASAPFVGTRALISFDEKAAQHYATIVASRQRMGRPISTADAQIAAMCRTYEASCATRNTKDFADTGVHIVNPWEFPGM